MDRYRKIQVIKITDLLTEFKRGLRLALSLWPWVLLALAAWLLALFLAVSAYNALIVNR